LEKVTVRVGEVGRIAEERSGFDGAGLDLIAVGMADFLGVFRDDFFMGELPFKI
jgi:hypothetical protein